jgi:hypothetical protein
MQKLFPSLYSTIPAGASGCKSIVIILGVAAVILDNEVDFPAFGNPTRPTSARTFNSSTFQPLHPVLRAGRVQVPDSVGVANRAFITPRPPFSQITSWPSSRISTSFRPLTSSLAIVPRGTSMYTSFRNAQYSYFHFRLHHFQQVHFYNNAGEVVSIFLFPRRMI